MKTLGIDQSYTNSGLVLINDQELDIIDLYKSDATTDKPARAWEIAQHIGNIIAVNKPDVVAMEGLAFGMRGDATRDLAGLQFVIACILRYEHDTEVSIVSPRTVKKVATGNGKAGKMELFEALPATVQTAFNDTGAKKTTGLLDLTDAYWIAKIASDPEFKSQGFAKPKKGKK